MLGLMVTYMIGILLASLNGFRTVGPNSGVLSLVPLVFLGVIVVLLVAGLFSIFLGLRSNAAKLRIKNVRATENDSFWRASTLSGESIWKTGVV